MSSVRIITDSSAELTPQEAADLGVTVLPLRYSIGGVTHREGVDISSERLLELIAQTGGSVTPMPPLAEEVARLLEGITRAGEVALFLHVANGLLPVGEPIQSVAQNLFGRARIEVIDSLAVSYTLRRIVQEAARAAARGLSLPAITQMARAMISRVYTLFYTDDFESLEKTVDINPAQAILASILGVKPLLVLEEGRLLPLEKITPRTTPVDKLSDFVFEFAGVAEMAVLIGPRKPDFDVGEFRQRILQQYPNLSIPIVPFGPLVAATVGTSAIGVYVFEGLQSGW
jgi:DegV family protein with EDD domain